MFHANSPLIAMVVNVPRPLASGILFSSQVLYNAEQEHLKVLQVFKRRHKSVQQLPIIVDIAMHSCVVVAFKVLKLIQQVEQCAATVQKSPTDFM